MKLTRRQVLVGTAGVTTAAAVGIGVKKALNVPSERKRGVFTGHQKRDLNILFVMSDQERAWDMYPTGFIEQHCPARQWLLEHGTYIDGAVTPSQLCSMARGMVYSGQHAQKNGVWDNAPIPFADNLHTSIPTMGTLMQDAGYTTGYAGKWHLSKLHPNNIPLPSQEVRSIIQGYGFEHTELGAERDGALVGFNEDAETVDASLRFVEQQKQTDKPWFLAVNLVNPHDVMYYTANDKMTQSRLVSFPDRSTRPPDTPFYQQDLGYDVLGEWGPSSRQGKPTAITEYAKSMEGSLGYLPFDNTDIARDFQNYYWNCTRDSDRQIKRLIDGLAASGELERTIIVFTSDHGEYLGVHGLRGKGTSSYREATNVPLVIVHPEGSSGQTVESQFSHIDLVPTLLGLAGVEQQQWREQFPELKGHDLSALADASASLKTRPSSGLLTHWTSLAFLDHASATAFKPVLESSGLTQQFRKLRAVTKVQWQNRGQMRGCIDSRWKFARYFSPGDHHTPKTWEELVKRNDIELYDMQADPSEINNVAMNSEYKEQVMRMNQKTNELIAEEIGSDEASYLPIFAKI